MKQFVVTISRGYGSGGKQIGIMLASELGIPYYDQDILHFASEDSGINMALFARADEKVRLSAAFKAAVAGAAYGGDVIPPDKKSFVSDENLFNYQAKIIKQLAAQESCVIIGRAADFLLEGQPNVFRVNIQSTFADSVRVVMQRSQVSEKEAQRMIRRIDKERADFYHYYTGRKWDDEMNFDLTLNTSRMDWATAVKLIRSYLALRLGE